MQTKLCIERGVQCITGGMKRGAKGIADNLENMAPVVVNTFIKDLMVACKQTWQGFRVLLRKLGTAFDICKQEGNRAGWTILPFYAHRYFSQESVYREEEESSGVKFFCLSSTLGHTPPLALYSYFVLPSKTLKV